MIRQFSDDTIAQAVRQVSDTNAIYDEDGYPDPQLIARQVVLNLGLTERSDKREAYRQANALVDEMWPDSNYAEDKLGWETGGKSHHYHGRN